MTVHQCSGTGTILDASAVRSTQLLLAECMTPCLIMLLLAKAWRIRSQLQEHQDTVAPVSPALHPTFQSKENSEKKKQYMPICHKLRQFYIIYIYINKIYNVHALLHTSGCTMRYHDRPLAFLPQRLVCPWQPGCQHWLFTAYPLTWWRYVKIHACE